MTNSSARTAPLLTGAERLRRRTLPDKPREAGWDAGAHRPPEFFASMPPAGGNEGCPCSRFRPLHWQTSNRQLTTNSLTPIPCPRRQAELEIALAIKLRGSSSQFDMANETTCSSSFYLKAAGQEHWYNRFGREASNESRMEEPWLRSLMQQEAQGPLGC